ncbi:MAG: TatD family hydrolase [Paludibacteraceae bacterium]|nr:TatD family hydrolase [Paludibacteraceae bacterium]
MRIIETHAHLDDPQYAEDLDAVVLRAKQAGVEKILLASVTMRDIDKLKALENRYPGYVYTMIGIHPQEVNAASYKDELDAFDRAIADGKYIAVGEIGMDLYWDKTTRAEQEIVFRHQIEAAVEINLPIAIHAREAFQPTVDILREFDKTKLRGVLHCFSGAPENAQTMMSLGDFYFGIGGVSTFKNAKFTERLAEIPLDMIVLETDCPYLAPTPHRGERNEPSFLPFIADKLAAAYGKTVEEIGEITTNNAERLFF